ncbi:golgin subfamily A member 6-like protein 22 [Eutrema salsugineum]|uniref:golgin subfamily A member 6-like protein 22 n=1 Tax=Eutrema salsugineum TaxID=72664 RepID=UPI000CED7422|nr:golgin subfamily A member 6-like protein 22 [Eutrema salsugineum]
MEALYAKLYDKYTKLKKSKFSEIDEVNREQEEKFLNFVSASEDLTQHLKSENKNLQGLVENLMNEIASIRSTWEEERLEYQKCLAEEEQKIRALSEEVGKLKELIQEGDPHNSKRDQSGRKQERKTPESSQVTTRSMRKRSRQSEDMVETDMVSPRSSIRHKSTETLLVSQPQCSKTTDDGSINSAGRTFQALSEHLLGMKLSINNEEERACIIALHPSSGLSFSLTWVNNSTGEESELLYKVVSLGTYERVAPKWMRHVIKFSTSMCPVFFERVSRVVKLQR